MKTTLILLDTPILVSDEIPKVGEKCIRRNGEMWNFTEADSTVHNKMPDSDIKGKKIIAGIHGLPVIDYNGFEEELGIVDVEKIIKTILDLPEHFLTPNDWKVEFGIKCFKACQLLNKNKFSELDLQKAYLAGTNDGTYHQMLIDDEDWEAADHNEKKDHFAKVLQRLSQPKQIEVEVEMEWITEGDEDHDEGGTLPGSIESYQEPKIINNSIKIIKVLK